MIEQLILETWPESRDVPAHIQTYPSLLHGIWRVSFPHKSYLVKTYGALPKILTCFAREKSSAKEASQLDLTAPILESDQAFIQEWVEGDQKYSTDEALELLARLHQSPLQFADIRRPREMARHYLEIGQDDQMEEQFGILQDLWQALDKDALDLVPSHCDTMAGHFLKTRQHLYLIDWEYAGMAEPYWDLAIFADSISLPITQEAEFLRKYEIHNTGKVELSRYRFRFYRIALRFIAGCWASAALRQGHRSREMLALRRSALELIS